MSQKMFGTRIDLQNQTVERVNPNTSCYRWKIIGYNNKTKKAYQYIKSPQFSSINSKVKWGLKLYPNKSDSILFGIYYFSWIDAEAHIELSIINVDNEIMEAFKLEKELTLEAYDRGEVGYEWIHVGDFYLSVKRSDIEAPENRLLADDCLTISFHVTLHDQIVKLPISSKNSKEHFKDTRLNLFDNFGKLLENGKFSDVKFVIGDKEIHVHKAVLASRSPVFDAMFRHQMQENEKNIVVIVDIDYVVMKELFRFMYTGTVANIDLMASDLLVAADKYCIKRLKALCEKSLLNSLSVENVLQRLKRAEQYNLGNLKKQILDFIVKHCTRVVRKDEFASLPPHLMCEITRAMAPKVNAD